MYDSLFIIITSTTLASLLGLISYTDKNKGAHKIIYITGFSTSTAFFLLTNTIEIGATTKSSQIGIWLFLTYQTGLVLFLFSPVKNDNHEKTWDHYLIATIFFIYSYLPLGIIGTDFGWWSKTSESTKWNAENIYSVITMKPWDNILFSQFLLFLVSSITTYLAYENAKNITKLFLKWKTLEKITEKTKLYVKNNYSGFFLVGLLNGLVVCIVVLAFQLVL